MLQFFPAIRSYLSGSAWNGLDCHLVTTNIPSGPNLLGGDFVSLLFFVFPVTPYTGY